MAAQSVKEIHITSVLRLSAHTVEIHWQERMHGVQSGQLKQTAAYIAQLTYQYGKPSKNTHILRVNPFGFYITHLSWSEDQFS